MPLIDADVHNAFTYSRGELRPFLPRLWQEPHRDPGQLQARPSLPANARSSASTSGIAG